MVYYAVNLWKLKGSDEMKMTKVTMIAACAAAVTGLAATVRPADDGRALVNPGMGWTMHYYSNVPRNNGSTI